MKVTNTRKIVERIAEYQKRNELNSLISMGICAPLLEEIVFDDEESLLSFAKSFQEDNKKMGHIYSTDESIIASIILSIVSEVFGDTNDSLPIPALILEEIVHEGRVFHRDSFQDNLYLKNIHFQSQKNGNFELTNDMYKRYEVNQFTVPAFKHNGISIPRIGVFDHDFKYPCIRENGATWMSVTPNEILTMEKPIAEANGDVLTLGCGMGYYAYMVSEKEDVNHVTIIEREQSVIDLFTSYILPQFGHKEKITIIKSDAIEYMKELVDGTFDYCFADIWISNMDYIPYLKVKECSKKFKKMKMSYWIEDSIVASLLHSVNIIILEGLYAAQGISIPELPSEEMNRLAPIRKLFENESITRPEHVDYYMDYRNIITLLS